MPRGTKTGREAKRRVVAAGAIAGAPAPKIAKKAGCSTRHVQRLANEPETQSLIAEAMRPVRDQLRLMAKRAVDAVERAMRAQKKTKADHFTQLRAVERFGDLIELAEGERRSDSRASGAGRRLVTWEEFLIIGKGRVEAA
jgi:hypothetical protein